MISLYLLTTPGREESLAATLRELAACDWGEPPRIIRDSGAPSDWALARGHLEVLRRALADAASHFLILEDDLRIARHLRHNLERWPPLQRGGLHFATLYNPGLRESSRAEPRSGAVEGPGAINPALPTASGALPESGPAWFAADPPACFGGQARIFSRECAAFILEKMPGPGLQQDPQMARLAAQLGPLWVHMPSLVQHTGRTSTWSATFHEAIDFDPEWRAE